jgi:hypothetical protein
MSPVGLEEFKYCAKTHLIKIVLMLSKSLLTGGYGS